MKPRKGGTEKLRDFRQDSLGSTTGTAVPSAWVSLPMIPAPFCWDAAGLRGFTGPVKTKKIHQSRSLENFFKIPHKI